MFHVEHYYKFGYSLFVMATPLGACLSLIRKMFQLNPKRRRSGRDRRNLGSMDGSDFGASLQSGFRRSLPE